MECAFGAPDEVKKSRPYHEVNENVEKVLTLTPLPFILTPLRDGIHV